MNVPAPSPAALPALYVEARALLRARCREIPVFGRIRPAIPMAKNFINLRLACHFEEHEEKVLHSRIHPGYRDPDDEKVRPRTERRLDVKTLWADYADGCILGLPGAGKTTILRHFAHLVLERQPEALVLFIECRRFTPAHFGLRAGVPPRPPRDPLDALQPLAAATLTLAAADSEAPAPTLAELAALTAHLRTAWREKRAVILLDALDELADEPVRIAFLAVFRTLISTLPATHRPPPGDIGGNRLFLSARRNEWDNLQGLERPVFEVEPLDQEQMRDFARALFGAESPVYARFDDRVWREPVLQKMGRTPLTALLLLCYFEYYEEFDVRYRTYDLLLRFTLLTVWAEIKRRGFVAYDRAALADFFRTAAQPDFEIRHAALQLRYQAFAAFAFECLYDNENGRPARDFHEDSLHTFLATFLQDHSASKEEATTTALEWQAELARAHVLIRTGARHWVFVHSTLLEFLAARHLLDQAEQPATVALVATPPSLRHADAYASLETLPIAAGGPQAAELFAALEPHFPPTSSLDHLSLLLRARAEVEAGENKRLARQGTRRGREAIAIQLAPARAARAWAYTVLAARLSIAGAEDLTHWRRHVESELRLTCELLPALHFASWWRGTENLPSLTADCLATLLHHDLLAQNFARHRPTVVEDNAQRTLLGHYRNYLHVERASRSPRAMGSPLLRFLGSPAFNHGSAINALAIHPREPWAVTGGDDSVLRLWDLRTGTELRAFPGHHGPVLACAFSPDGARLLSASHDKTLFLWDSASGHKLRTFSGHTRSVNACVFSPDGARLLSASDDKTLLLWDTASGIEIRAFCGHAGYVNACAFSPDGTRLLSASSDNTLRLWDTVSGRQLHAFSGHQGPIRDCAFSPDGALLLSASDDKTLRSWDASSGLEMHTFSGHNDCVSACAFSPTGTSLLSGSDDSTLRLWDTASGAELKIFSHHQGHVLSCAYDRDGPRLYSVSSDQTLRLWDRASGRQLNVSAGHKDCVLSCAFSPDGNRLLSASYDQTLRIWDTSSGIELRTLSDRKGYIFACAFSPDGTRAISASSDSTLRLWDLASGLELRAFAGHQATVRACVFSPDGTRLLSTSDDKTLRLWDVSSGLEIRAFCGHRDYVRACVFSLDGASLLSASDDKTLRLWDTASGKELRTLAGHTDYVRSCVFSPDGTRLLSASDDKTLRLWDAASGSALHTFSGHTGSVQACAFSPDGTRLLSASFDKTLRLWDAASGANLSTWHFTWRLYGLAVNPRHPTQVAVTGANGTVALIDWSL